MKKLLAAVLVLAMVGSASAVTVQMWVESDGSNYAVKARLNGSELAQTAGIALANVALSGASTVVNELPAAYNGKSPVVGFVLFRSGTGAIPDNPVGASQDSIGSGSGADVLYDLGLVAVDWSDWVDAGYTVYGSTSVPRAMTVASGTYTGAAPTIVRADFTVFAETRDGDAYVPDAVLIIPEPATLGLLGLGGAAVLRRRWR